MKPTDWITKPYMGASKTTRIQDAGRTSQSRRRFFRGDHSIFRSGPVLKGLCLVLLGLLPAGCNSYQLRGVVVEGAVSAIMIVDKTDPRLADGDGLPMAVIDVALDPDRLSREPLPRGISNVDGSFAIPVDKPGAGYLEYDVRVLVRRSGYNTAVQDLRIPGPNKRLLVTLVNGEDHYRPEPENVLDETLRMGEPFMR